jgi:lactoylglutathione lyase
MSGNAPLTGAIGQLHVTVSDIGRSVAFYRDVLGLALRSRAGEDWAEFDVAGTTVALHGTREGHAPPQGGATVVFEVDDLEGEMNALRGKNVTFDGEVAEVPGYGRFVSFRDPDGNILQIFERAAHGHP